MENLDKCIVAISTATGNGGISIIRVSGKNALSIADQVFVSKGGKKPSSFEPRKLYLGTFSHKEISDICMCVYFRGPYSYTGEDIIEFQCHGGMTLTNHIYESLVDIGCYPATKGEFSKIAFLNGKLSLDEAEGTIDLINAESESELKAGYTLMQGGLRREVENLQTNLTELLAKIEVTLDYPEEDLEEETCEHINNQLLNTKNSIENLLSTAELGKAIKDGTIVTIYGKTNAGKSSILNALLGYDRAIVTDIQGTTRDTLEETFIYKGYKFILIDTAGIRESSDVVENIGISKSKEMINRSDIILFVVDSSCNLDSNDFDIIDTLSDKNVLLVVNKVDLPQVADLNQIPFKDRIFVSTKDNNSINNLKEKLFSFVSTKSTDNNAVIITNKRHIEALKQAKDYTNTAINSLNNGYQLDLVSIDIKNIWLSLGDITGSSDNEKIIDDIFSKFCVGK